MGDAPYGTTLASQGMGDAPYGTTLASQGMGDAPYGTTLASYRPTTESSVARDVS
jgi:hypothetical protein